jgi:acyl-coenzyme A thioesterase PaaI-like protein
MRLTRWRFNLIPAYRGTGGVITYIADDWHEVRLKLPLNVMTRNYVGTIYGGSMYGAIDPVYMLMLIRILGSDYVVWDKAATIQFKRPGRTTLFARLVIDESELMLIRESLEQQHSIDRVYTVHLTDAQGVIHAVVDKTLYIRRAKG